MQFIDFQNQLSFYPIFSLQDVRKVFSDFSYRQLDRWGKKAYLKKNIGVADSVGLKKYMLQKTAKLNFEELAKDVESLLFDPRDKRKVLLFREFLREGL